MTELAVVLSLIHCEQGLSPHLLSTSVFQGCFRDAKMHEIGVVVKKSGGWVVARLIKRHYGKNCC